LFLRHKSLKVELENFSFQCECPFVTERVANGVIYGAGSQLTPK